MDVKKNLTQSNGTVGFITLKYIYGDDEEQKLVDVMENQIMDFQNQLACLCYTYDYESLKSYYLGHNKKILSVPTDFSWFTRIRKAQLCDLCHLWCLNRSHTLETKCLDEFPDLKAFVCHLEILG